jgi:chromosome segregation ATPase
MRGALAKEQRRNLKNTIGDTAAAAVANLAGEHATLQLQHRTLATQMHEFERTVATLREARAQDLKTIDGLKAELAKIHTIIANGQAEAKERRADLWMAIRYLERPWSQRLRDWWRNREA